MSAKRRRGGPPYYCRLRHCPRAGKPFETRGALGSHRRRVHGLRAISEKIKRPPGGKHRCPVAGCPERRPYVTLGGLGLHLNRKHGVQSTKLDAIKKREYRANTRAQRNGEVDAIATSFGRPGASAQLPPIPDAPPITRARARLTPGQMRLLAKRLLWLLQVEWARGLPGGAHPLDVRDAVAEIIVSNFAVLSTRSAAGETLSIALPAERRR